MDTDEAINNGCVGGLGLRCVWRCGSSGFPIKVNGRELVGAYLSNAPSVEARFRGHSLIVTRVSGGVDWSNTLTLIPGLVADIRGDASSVKCDSVGAEEND